MNADVALAFYLDRWCLSQLREHNDWKPLSSQLATCVNVVNDAVYLSLAYATAARSQASSPD
jgi:hypothetical protein